MADPRTTVKKSSATCSISACRSYGSLKLIVAMSKEGRSLRQKVLRLTTAGHIPGQRNGRDAGCSPGSTRQGCGATVNWGE
jgi:hypothetical protein